MGGFDDHPEPFFRFTKRAHFVEAIDHRAEDGGVGAKEFHVILRKVAGVAAVDLEQAIRAAARQKDRHIGKRDDARGLQEGWQLEPRLGPDIAACDGHAGLDRERLGREFAHRQAKVANDTGVPADAGAHEQALGTFFDFQNFRPMSAEGVADKAAGFGQDVGEIFIAKRKLTEVGQEPLPLSPLLVIVHRRTPVRIGAFNPAREQAFLGRFTVRSAARFAGF